MMMKKLTTLATILIVSFSAKAQGNFEPFRDSTFDFEFLKTHFYDHCNSCSRSLYSFSHQTDLR